MKVIFLTILFLILTGFVSAKTVNITDFGATANDATNDRNAIQAAIDDLKTNGGGTILFPSGESVSNATGGLGSSLGLGLGISTPIVIGAGILLTVLVLRR